MSEESYMDWLKSMCLVDDDEVTEGLPIIIILEDEYSLYKDWPDWGYSKEAIERKRREETTWLGCQSSSGSRPFASELFRR